MNTKGWVIGQWTEGNLIYFSNFHSLDGSTVTANLDLAQRFDTEAACRGAIARDFDGQPSDWQPINAADVKEPNLFWPTDAERAPHKDADLIRQGHRASLVSAARDMVDVETGESAPMGNDEVLKTLLAAAKIPEKPVDNSEIARQDPTFFIREVLENERREHRAERDKNAQLRTFLKINGLEPRFDQWMFDSMNEEFEDATE